MNQEDLILGGTDKNTVFQEVLPERRERRIIIKAIKSRPRRPLKHGGLLFLPSFRTFSLPIELEQKTGTKVHTGKENHMYGDVRLTFSCQFADEVGLKPDRELFENNAQYVRTALVAYNAVFDDMGDLSKPEYLIKIVEDSISK